MFGIGTTEVLVILVVALLVIGPSKLPDVARALGKGLAEFRRMTSDVKRTIDLESHVRDLDKTGSPDASTGQEDGKKEKDSFSEQDTAVREQKPDSQEDWSLEKQNQEHGPDQAQEKQKPDTHGDIPEVSYSAEEDTSASGQGRGTRND